MKSKADWILEYTKKRGGNPRFVKKTWETFRLEKENATAIEAIMAFEFFGKAGIYLYGPTGTGKSHIAKAMFNHFVSWKYDLFSAGVEELRFPVWISMSEFLESQRGEPDRQIKKHVYGAAILFIDDFGVTGLTEWGRDQVWNLINHCYENEKQLVITSNESIISIGAMYGDRVASRLKELTLELHIGGKDNRVEKQNENIAAAVRRIQQRKDIV